MCERNGWEEPIRYKFLTYQPQWGYLIVGSTCVEYLTQVDQNLGIKVLKIFKRISKFLNETDWERRIYRNGKEYLLATFFIIRFKYMGKRITIFSRIGIK